MMISAISRFMKSYRIPMTKSNWQGFEDAAIMGLLDAYHRHDWSNSGSAFAYKQMQFFMTNYKNNEFFFKHKPFSGSVTIAAKIREIKARAFHYQRRTGETLPLSP